MAIAQPPAETQTVEIMSEEAPPDPPSLWARLSSLVGRFHGASASTMRSKRKILLQSRPTITREERADLHDRFVNSPEVTEALAEADAVYKRGEAASTRGARSLRRKMHATRKAKL